MLDASLFTKYSQGSLLIEKAVKKTERGELMKEMVDNLNVTRIGKFKPISMARMGTILQNIPTDALYVLSSKCRQEASRKPKTYFQTYSKIFWYELRPH
jgi:hypothetical protein